MLGIVAHAHRAGLMNDLAADRNRIHAAAPEIASARRFPPMVSMIEVNVSCMWCTCLISCSRPLEMETQHRDAPLIHRARIDLAVRIGVGNHLAAAGESHPGAVLSADLGFQRRAVAFSLRAVEAADLRHVESAADLDVITAREILLLVVEQPPRHVDVHAADAVANCAAAGRPAPERGR